MSRVYVVQRQMRREAGSRELVDVYDLSAAKDYGDLVEILPPGTLPFRPASQVKQMHCVLQHFTKDDYLLLIGNPALIGWATAIAAHYCPGRIKQLQWSKQEQSYRVIEANIFDKGT